MIEKYSSTEYKLQAGHLGLKFAYERDRWRHELAVCHAGDWRVLLESEEGAPGDVNLPSPAFQDLRLEKLGDEIREFQLLGQAGRAVYSAAIRMDCASLIVSFDIFARSGRAGGTLSAVSTYRVAPGVELLRLKPDTLALGGSNGLELVSGQPVDADVYQPQRIRVPGERINAGSGSSGSVRWRYRIRALISPAP